jgi:hypothetical protein
MASPLSVVFCGLAASVFWIVLGFALTRHLLPRVLAIGAAPVVGWAAYSAATLPVFILIGFSRITVVSTGALALVVAAGSLMTRPAYSDAAPDPAVAPHISLWGFGAAVLLALVPTVAILPKFSAGGVQLADPIFDHSKIAIIDAMTRQGLPPVNPIFGEFAPGQLSYYYLWHFSAAELALPLRVSGWEADVALTWFTAFAALVLMMGLAVWLSKRSSTAVVVVILAAGTSLWEVFRLLFGSVNLEPFLASPSGFAGWLFQAAWVPQHAMSASCVIAAMLLLLEYAKRQRLVVLLTLVVIVVAGFESSAFVGGVTFAIAAIAAAPILLAAAEPKKRIRFALGLGAAGVLVICLAAPFILDQLATVKSRGGGIPIVIRHFAVLGDMFSPALRHVLDLPAYWLILLPIEFPATFFAGVIALAVLLRSTLSGPEKTAVAALATLAATGLIIPWLLVSTLGDNNDLGLRAVLPAAMILIVAAAAGMLRSPRRALIAATALIGLILAVPGTVSMIQYNFTGSPNADGRIFAASPELWAAVRRYAPPTARVANNPLFLEDVTPWPVNMSWALFADRSSCFAGRELAIAFAPLSPDRREAINAQFIRVFDGKGTPDDIGDMARKYACDVVVVVPQDKAWDADPFASSTDYRLAESRAGQWRIYVLNH